MATLCDDCPFKQEVVGGRSVGCKTCLRNSTPTGPGTQYHPPASRSAAPSSALRSFGRGGGTATNQVEFHSPNRYW